MAEQEIRINIPVKLAGKLLIEKMSAKLVSKKHYHTSDGEIIFLVFQKYFVRTSSNAALFVTIDNVYNRTIATIISTGSGQGLLQQDYGAADSFVKEAVDILTKYNDTKQVKKTLSNDNNSEFDTLFLSNEDKTKLVKELDEYITKNRIEVLDEYLDYNKEEDLYTAFITYKK